MQSRQINQNICRADKLKNICRADKLKYMQSRQINEKHGRTNFIWNAVCPVSFAPFLGFIGCDKMVYKWTPLNRKLLKLFCIYCVIKTHFGAKSSRRICSVWGESVRDTNLWRFWQILVKLYKIVTDNSDGQLLPKVRVLSFG